MADIKYDGIVEGVRYTPEGKIKLVRMYLRRGPVWGDRVLLTREDFLDILHSGKRMAIGKRLTLMGGDFQVSAPIQAKGSAGQEVLYTSSPMDGRDNLEGAPIF